ncbi:hypothetical protein CN378_19060 [Bacillus sp. AFS015802]|uniref:hypothetical protein n=1 Tax=Bacillus sp. AFS015802 TaxID=2033486 RepID=UPI000BF8BB11|nr:hypothetical protein [Bacillus sp. AFS015802]PFA63129.1 hypothetical protein CN378_19060 [Bacillus sp. AFS015802]
MQYVKMIRFHHDGFTCGSPNVNKERKPVFINREIHNLFHTCQSVYTTEMILPPDGEKKWDGCFCYLEEYTLSATGIRNIGFLPRESVIWVRNISHMGKDTPYFDRSIHPLVEEGTGDGRNIVTDTWVKMSVVDALERTRLWKEKNVTLPDWLTECYLVEPQVKSLIYPSANEKIMEFWLSKN